MISGSGLRVCGRGAKKAGEQALGRSRGGFSRKLHALIDALGNPLTFSLTAGEMADISQAPALLEHVNELQAVLADKAYDADHLIQHIEERGGQPVIPRRRHRNTPRPYDKAFYKDRNLIERFFNRIKQFRRIATRYKKLARRRQREAV
jgi:putative transposase